jgi:DNA-binding CsgD family transcriptional regulator
VTEEAERLLAPLLAVATAEGVPADLLGLTDAAGGQPDVDTVLVASSRLQIALGGPSALLEASTQTAAWTGLAIYAQEAKSPDDLVLAAWESLLTSPRSMLKLGWEDATARPLVLTARLPPGRSLRGGLDMLLAGAVRTAPLFYALGPAHVDCVWSDGTLSLVVTLPPTEATASTSQFSGRLPPSGHLSPVVKMLDDRLVDRQRRAETALAAQALGEGLAAARTSEDVAEMAMAVLTRHLGFSVVRLWAGPTVRERRLLASVGGIGQPSPASTDVLALTTRNGTIGLLELDHHGDVDFARTLLPWISGELHRRIAGERARARSLTVTETVEPIDRAWGLTTRQAEVAALVGQGLANKEIALAIGCSCATVEEHLTAVYRKAGVTGRGPLLAALLGTAARAS